MLIYRPTPLHNGFSTAELLMGIQPTNYIQPYLCFQANWNFNARVFSITAEGVRIQNKVKTEP